jgi:hypothetical protein
MKIEDITVQQYINAFGSIEVTDLEKKLIISNYDFPEHTITSKQMARHAGFAGMAAANGNYGNFAKKFCKYFDVNIRVKVGVFVSFKKIENGWRWILRPKVVLALEKIGWVTPKVEWNNAIQEVEDYKGTEAFNIDETERDAVIKSRVGQGKFRASLIEMWGECSVTGCQVTDVLRASHIKPWRFSTNAERLNAYNGLLLLPNLDALFDLGLISFKDNGEIIISNRISSTTLESLSIHSEMRIQKVDDRHLAYLKFHRENIFKP